MVASFCLKGENKSRGKAGREEAEGKRTAAKSELEVASVLTEQAVWPPLAAGKAIFLSFNEKSVPTSRELVIIIQPPPPPAPSNPSY